MNIRARCIVRYIRVMADGTDGARAAAMDEWIVWKEEERIVNLITFSFLSTL
jgi:hypothetical protein